MKKNSQVFALKYRPQTFKDLVGHFEVSKAIYNSIKINKSANAFLFTGIRGIGKTTFARIVAKALNCENGIEKLCSKNFCSNCLSIINSNHIDVLEIDAASRTGVDDVRELLEFSRYSPSVAKYKVFIIDEVHMLSKQAFNALLKTLEEPPSYLKFIFATTEIKKIPVTVLSRCQRYNLSRIGSDELFRYIKSICLKEDRKVNDKALKLIVKISEGSVRDALSLLDRALLSTENEELLFENAQKIFGYVDKSTYIKLLELVLNGDEKSVLKHYRNIYISGVDPTNFLNDFLEILYFTKNISHLAIDGTNFTLNDNEYNEILSLSKKTKPNTFLLFWEYTLKTVREMNLVSNKNILIEMFLIQLIYIKNSKNLYQEEKKNIKINNSNNQNNIFLKQSEVVSQIKNIQQEDNETEKKNDKNQNKINNLEDLIKTCIDKKEIKLKYELENNVNLVSFSKYKIEISFNPKLNKDFVKNLSDKLFEWTNKRWIILFSNQKGEISKKDEKIIMKDKIMNEYKSSNEYNKILGLIPDIELTDIEEKK